MKSNFLLILFILITGIFNYLPFINLNNDLYFIISFIFSIIGALILRSRNVFKSKKFLKSLVVSFCVTVALVLACIFPIIEYNQGMIESFAPQRYNLSFLVLVSIAYISPSYSDVFIAIERFSYVVLACMLISAIFPYNFFLSEDRLNTFEYYKSIGSPEFITAKIGVRYLILYFCLLTERVLTAKNRITLYKLIAVLIVLVLFQNRSYLIFVIPVSFYILLKLNLRFKIYSFVFISLFLIFYLDSILNGFDFLLNESIDQISNGDYNRWQSFSFYLIEFESNVFSNLFGHGFPPGDSEFLDIMQRNRELRNTFISDIGVFGTYFCYGLYGICIYFFLVYRGLYSSLGLKLFSFFMLLVPTINDFLLINSGDNVLYACFVYLILIHNYDKH